MVSPSFSSKQSLQPKQGWLTDVLASRVRDGALSLQMPASEETPARVMAFEGWETHATIHQTHSNTTPSDRTIDIQTWLHCKLQSANNTSLAPQLRTQGLDDRVHCLFDRLRQHNWHIELIKMESSGLIGPLRFMYSSNLVERTVMEQPSKRDRLPSYDMYK